MRTRLGILLLLFLAAIAGAQESTPPPNSAPQEEMIPEEAQQQQWSKLFHDAETTFNSANQADCIPLFQNLIAQITEQRMKHGLSEPEQLLLYRSLDYLGQVFFGEGQQEQSAQVYLKLIELNPNYQINQDLVSSKIVEFVKQIKVSNLGTMNISSDPLGATVKLDGNSVGVTNLETIYGLKGDHELEVSKPGFVPQKQTVSIVPGKNVKVNVKLERSSSVAYFITYPKDIEILLGGKRLGVTGGDTNDRGTRAATEKSLPPGDFSGEFAIPDLQPGQYEVEFRRPCWETETRRITIDKNDDYFFEPIILNASRGFLNITADDDKANIFVDNEYLGIAPKQKLQVCSGKHVLKLKGPRGKFERQLDVKKDQTMDIAAKLNPSLTFLGLLAAPDVLKADVERLATEIRTRLADLQNLNFVDASSQGDRAALEDSLRQIREGIDGNKPDKERRTIIQGICTKVESDLLLVGYVQKESLQRNVQFYLLSNWSSMADQRTVQVFDADQWKTFKTELDYEEPLFEKRLGVHLIDTLITPGPVISQVLLKSQGEAQALNAGDILMSASNKPVKTSGEAQQAVREAQAKDDIALSVQRGGAQIPVTLKMVNSPMEIQFNNPNLLFNRQLVAFKNAINLSTNPLEKNIALLNIGLCHMHFAEYDVAFEQLRLVQLNRSLGIGQGTVDYRIAQCYRELGYRKEAQDTLDDASKFPQNTIYSDDGPSLAREIQRAKSALQ